MMAEIGCLLLLICLAMLAVVIIVCLVLDEPSDPYQERIRRIKAAEDEVMREMDETGAYYAGLYRYIGQRLDDQSSRRQSG